MFRMVLFTQWKWSRALLIPALLAAFALPLLSVEGAGSAALNRWQVTNLLDGEAGVGVLYPMLAAAVGLLLAMTAWGPDHHGRHVYSMSLPLPRWHLVLLRLGSGAVLLACLWLALWVGSLVAVSLADVPQGLRTYPHLLTLRFILASLVAFGCFFAISAGTVRTAGVILSVIAGLFLLQLVLTSAGLKVDLVGPILNGLFTWPGPLDVFTGRWMLLDV